MHTNYDSLSKEELLKKIEELEIKVNQFENDRETFREDRIRLELAIDTVDMAWWGMDIPTGKVEFHKRKAEMLGYSPEKFNHYTDFTNLVHPDDHEIAMESMRNHFKGIARTYETAYRILTSEGEYKWFYDIGAIVKKDDNGAPLKIVGFVIDMTKQKTVEMELKEANENLLISNAEKDKFFSIIAHDLRGPLGTLIQMAEILNDEDEDITSDESQKLLMSLGTSAKNAFKLLENLLEWSRMKSGRITFDPRNLSLNEVVGESMRLLTNQAGFKNIKILSTISIRLIVFADKDMLSLIIRNLVSNSIKFTNSGGEVKIDATDPGDGFIKVSITDSGIGMSEEMVDKLFRIDRRVSRSGTAGEPSSGLGLLLCHEFVEKHGGTISVDSKENIGTSFSFTLPKAQ